MVHANQKKRRLSVPPKPSRQFLKSKIPKKFPHKTFPKLKPIPNPTQQKQKKKKQLQLPQPQSPNQPPQPPNLILQLTKLLKDKSKAWSHLMISRGKGADLKPRISPHRRDIHQRLDVSQKLLKVDMNPSTVEGCCIPSLHF